MAIDTDDSKSPRRRLQKIIPFHYCKIILIGFLLLCLSFAGVVEWFFRLPDDENIALFEARNFPSSLSLEERNAYLLAEQLKRKYTVRINTFRRNDLLKQVVGHYVTCPNIDNIQIIWSDLTNTPPVASFYGIPGLIIESTNSKVLVSKDDKLNSKNPRIQYEIHDVDSLNNRFRPKLPINTEAVLSVDDDLHLPCDLLDFTHNVWRQSPRTMVGFMPRMHGHEDGHFTYLDWWHVWRHGVYSLILTKACFLHQDFLHYYAGTRQPNYALLSASMPPPSSATKVKHSDQDETADTMRLVHEYVDKHMNCEDLAMSFLVANLTHLPAVWVRGEGISEIGHRGLVEGLFVKDQGISSNQASHYAARSACVDSFVSLFGNMPLTTSSSKVDRASHFWLWR